MSRKLYRILAAVLMVGTVAALPSCGLPQRLDGISIQPTAVFFNTPAPNATANLKVYGSFLHPVATKEITSQVVWSTDADGLVTVSQEGVVTTVGNCGVVNVIASVTNSPHTPSGQVYVAHSTVTVADATQPDICPKPQP